MLWLARCNAVIEDEQAVSIVILGPLRLKNHEMRFDSSAGPVPVAVYFGALSMSYACISQ